MLRECCANAVRMLCECSANAVRMLCECCANAVRMRESMRECCAKGAFTPPFTILGNHAKRSVLGPNLIWGGFMTI